MSKILELTAQQEALVTVYKEKWRQAAFNTQPLNQKEAFSVVELIYQQLLDSHEFEIFVFGSPLAVADLSFLSYIYPTVNLCNPKKLNNIVRKIENQLMAKAFLSNSFFENIVCTLIEQVGGQLDIQLWHVLRKKFDFPPTLNPIFINLRNSFETSPVWQAAKANQKVRLGNLWSYLTTGLLQSDSYLDLYGLFDFCVSELECSIDQELWHLAKKFVTECGWTFVFQDFCFICDRPCQILLDDQMRLHAENQPAIVFPDGFQVFAQHGEGYIISPALGGETS